MALDLQTQVPVRGLVQRELGQGELVQDRGDIDTIHPLPRRGLENNRRAPLQADQLEKMPGFGFQRPPEVDR